MIYATLDATLVPILLEDAGSFGTSWQRVNNAQEAAWTGQPIGAYAPVETSHGPGVLAKYGPDDLVRYRITTLEPPAIPEGQVLASRVLGYDPVARTITAQWTFTAAPVPPVPAEVSRGQAKQALLAAGKLDAVEAAIASAPRPVQIYWNDFPSFHRDHPTLLATAAALGMTSGEVDDLFRAAAQIR